MSVQEPPLPPDLLRVIFEQAAQSDKATALCLILAASRVRDWIEPVLYESVNLVRQRTSTLLLRTLETAKTREFYRKHVKSITFSVGAYSDMRCMLRILSICQDVKHLTIYFIPTSQVSNPAYPSSTLEQLVDGLHPTNLTVQFPTVSSSHLFSPEFHLPVYAHITHLSIVNDWMDWTVWRNLELLKSLSHLAADVRAPAESLNPQKIEQISHAVQGILCRCTSLKLFIIVLIFAADPAAAGEAIAQGMVADDRRLVFLQDPEPFRDRDAHWENDMWRLGAEIAAVQSRTGRLNIPHTRPPRASLSRMISSA